jgi:hypothetical protein
LTPALIRAALVGLSLLVVGWLVLSFRAVELEAEGAAVLRSAQTGTVAPAEVARARSAFNRARRFSADEAPLVNESLLLATVGRRSDAARLARRVVAEEPDNLEGAIVLYLATHNPRALRRVGVLNPWAAEALR